jgi:hypothetical protein
MAKVYAALDEDLVEFLMAQHVFFVATAPTGPLGHVNLSPKGLASFRVLAPNTVAYLDFNGSGVETIAHLRQNGRIVFMFCAFQGPPKIVRLYGKGRAIGPHEPEFSELLPRFSAELPARAIIQVTLERISDSCGYGVPRYRYEGERDQSMKWADKKGAAGIAAYQRQKNAESIDGLPGLPWLD